MKYYRNHILFALLFTFSNLAYAGGGWPQPKGKSYIKLSQWWIVSDQHYTDAGLIDPNVTLGIYNTSLYAEYGITDRLTGIIYAPLFSRSTVNNVISGTTNEILNEGDAINSFGDTDLSLKYGITKPGSKIAVSASILLGLPLGKDIGGRDNNLQTGDGEFNQMLRIDAGTGFTIGEHTNAFANVYGAYNNRSNGFSDEIRMGLEGGLAVAGNKLWLIGRLQNVQSRLNGSQGNQSTGTSIFSNNAEYTSVGAEISYKFTDKMGISAGYDSAVRGKIILASPSYSFGVFLDLK